MYYMRELSNPEKRERENMTPVNERPEPDYRNGKVSVERHRTGARDARIHSD